MEHIKTLHGWQVNKHPLPALWVTPQASSAAQQRNASLTVPLIAQYPTSSWGKILQLLFVCLFGIRAHFSKPILSPSPLRCCPHGSTEHCRAGSAPACTQASPQDISCLVCHFFSSFPQILPKSTLTISEHLQGHFCYCKCIGLTDSYCFFHILNRLRQHNFHIYNKPSAQTG